MKIMLRGLAFIAAFVALAAASILAGDSRGQAVQHPSCFEMSVLTTNWCVLTNDGINEWQAGLVVSNLVWVTSDGVISFTNIRSTTNVTGLSCPIRMLSVMPPLPGNVRGGPPVPSRAVNRYNTPPQPPVQPPQKKS